MKKVLVITCYFPPREAIGSVRLRGLAKYLPEFGWEPIILTPIPPGPLKSKFKIIHTPHQDVISALKEKLHMNPERVVEEQVRVLRPISKQKAYVTRKVINFTKNIIAYPDEYKGWHSIATKAIMPTLRNEKIDALISSSDPVTPHIIAKDLKIKYKIPWVADLRDLWTQSPYYQFGFIRKWFERKLEIRTLNHADALVTVSKPIAEELGSLHKEKRVHVITNGFDPEEIKELSLTKEFTITYTGHLHHGKRDPYKFFQAIREIADEQILDSDLVKIRFFGPYVYWLDKEIRKFGLEQMVSQHGKVLREVALVKQRESQILLLLNWDDPREKGTYTGKLFDYLCAKRPILAFGGPKGVVSELLEETAAGVYAPSISHIKKILAKWFTEYNKTSKVAYKGKKDKVQKYTHLEMARKFAQVLEKVIKK